MKRGAHLGMSVLALTALAAPSAHAFRTAEDLPAFAGSGKVRWAGGSITYRIDPNTPPGISVGDVEAIAAQAFSRWSAVSCSGVSFVSMGEAVSPAQPGDGINTIQWVQSGWTEQGFDPAAPAITNVQYEKDPAGGWRIVEADLYLNADNDRWIPSGEPVDDSRDLDSVLTHEAGHMLGLLHPCEIEGVGGAPDCASDPGFALTAMYPVYNPNRKYLSPDDEAGVCYLYPVSGCQKSGCSPGEVCADDGTCHATCGDGVVCAADERCTPDGCWPIDQCWRDECQSPACSADTDCPDGQTCRFTRCAGKSDDGDPCTADTQCAHGACTSGYCSQQCIGAGDCPAGGACDAPAGGIGTCRSPRKPMGAECAVPNDCLGNECLTHGAEPNRCTRTCDPTRPCPGNWQCQEVDGASVCTPPPPTALEAEGASCTIGAVAPSTSRPGPRGWVIALFISAGLFRRHRRRRVPFIGSKHPTRSR